MIRDIVKDTAVLQQKSLPFIFEEDEFLISDMLDTANAHRENCVGLAAVQIGTPKRVILVRFGENFIPFINPMIIHKSTKTYTVDEGCLSLEGTRRVKRHKSIKVVWTEPSGKKRVREFTGFPAQIIQHEIDHCNGILI